MPNSSSLRKHLESALDAIEEAHDIHIYSEDDDHPADCHYCAIVRDGREALARRDRQK